MKKKINWKQSVLWPHLEDKDIPINDKNKKRKCLVLDLTVVDEIETKEEKPKRKRIKKNETLKVEEKENLIQIKKRKPIKVCIDPAPKNCGICIYDMEKEEYIEVLRKAFIEDINVADVGNRNLTKAVIDFIEEERKEGGIFFDKENTFIFIENQNLGFIKNAKNLAIQNTFQILFNENCIPITPSSIKSHFREEFPMKEGANESQQYRLDKKNAVIFGKKILPFHLKLDIEEKYKKKQDDCYDAVVINRYVEDMFELKFDEVNEKYFFVKKKRSKRKK